MKFVVDTNIAFSAILNTKGKIGDLIMNSYGIFEWHACDALHVELATHRAKLLELSKMTEEQLNQSSNQILNSLIFNTEALIPFEMWTKAADLVRDVDMDDIAFVALNELLGAKLWTGDKELMRGLAEKGYTNFITTDELYKLRDLLR